MDYEEVSRLIREVTTTAEMIRKNGASSMSPAILDRIVRALRNYQKTITRASHNSRTSWD